MCNGVNILLLWLAAEARGVRSDRWLTPLQAQEAGGQVRKVETGNLAVFFNPFGKQAEDKHGNKQFDAQGEPLTESRVMLKSLNLLTLNSGEVCRSG